MSADDQTRGREPPSPLLRQQAKPVRRLLLAHRPRPRAALPEIVQIESTNICNAKCVFCPRDEMHREQGVMDMALFRKIADECAALASRTCGCTTTARRSPTASLVEKVRYAKSIGIREVGTDLERLADHRAAARGMVDAGLDAINISMDAAGKEVFESTRLGLNYDKVVANVERLIRIRDEAGKRRPKLILSFVRQNNSAEEQHFIAHWRKKADKIHVTDLHNWAGTLNQESDVRFPCYRPWLTFTVLWDGRVSLCCADFDGREVLGDLRTSTIKDIWNGPAYRKVRRAHLDHGGPSICQSCDLPKKDSPLWISLSWSDPRPRPAGTAALMTSTSPPSRPPAAKPRSARARKPQKHCFPLRKLSIEQLCLP